jgi:hypothetical protein
MYKYFISILICSIGCCSGCEIMASTGNGTSRENILKIAPDDNLSKLLFQQRKAVSIRINDPVLGGLFIYRPPSAMLKVDGALIFKSNGGGFWERQVADTLKLAWFGVRAGGADNTAAIRTGIQSAIDKQIQVVAFPASGIYKIMSGNYWTVGDRTNLQIDGNGAILEVDKSAANVAQETYVLAFRCTDLNSANSKVLIKDISIRAPGILPNWTDADYKKHKLVIAIETDGIHTVTVERSKLNDICGYGIRLKNFSQAVIDHVDEINVGGHFPIENAFDSFGDGIWLGHYDVQTSRSSRKNSYAKISDCTIRGYNTSLNGNFASRCGITVEGFNSYAPDVIVKVDVNDCLITDYDRNLHVEGISSNIKYTNCRIRNFFGIALVVKSTKTALAYDNCTASGLLAPNAKQERLGLGGAMQFDSYFDLMLTKTVFTFNRPATFRANIYLQDNSILDLSNSDVFFDHTNLYIKSGGAIINIPSSVARGYNMYGGRVKSEGGIFRGAKRGAAGVLHGESMEEPILKNNKLTNARLLFAGGFGVSEVK